MAAPETYRQEIQQIQRDSQLSPPSSNFEVLQNVNVIGNLQSRLRQMARQIKADMDAASRAYQENAKNVSGGSLLSGLFGRRQGNGDGKRQRQQLKLAHEQRLGAYKEALSTAGALFKQLEARKADLQSFLDATLARPVAQPDDAHVAQPTAQGNGQHRRRVDYYVYIKSAEWRKKAEEAKARAGNRCQICNRSRAKVQLEAHHRTYERLGDERPEDITVLCRECHELYESNKAKLTPPEPPPGHCLRCGVSIKYNPQAPYCASCYRVWKKYQNYAFKEKFCHSCGAEYASSMAKPLCRACYFVAKNSQAQGP